MADSGVCFGIIGGSGLLKSKLEMFASMTTEEVHTSSGAVVVRKGALPSGASVVFVQRHKASPSGAYAQPGDINYAAIALALQAQGCTCILGVCSVGSLTTSIPVGTFVVPDDWFSPHDVRRVSTGYSAHFMPTLDEDMRTALVDGVKAASLSPVAAGTYVNAAGPRFETKAEIRTFALSGQVLGMTAAHEATACGELGLKYAMLCLVDNMCNGVGAPFDVDAFHAAQDANRAALERVMTATLPAVEAVAAREGPATPPSDVAGDVTPGASASASSSSSSSSSSSEKEAVDLVVHARWVVPVEPADVVYEHHALVIRGGSLVAILPSHEAVERYDAATVVRKPRHAVMPGLVNAHTHLGMTALRGLGDDLPLFEWLSTAIWPTEGRLMSDEYVRAGVRIGLAEMVRGGTTCVNDMYFFPEVLAEELCRAGVRGCVGAPVMEFPSAWAGGADEYMSKAEAAFAKAKADDAGGLLTFAVAPHAPYTVKDESFVKAKAMADRLDLRLHVHLHETKAEVDDSVHGNATPNKHLSSHKCSPVTNLLRLGVLSERSIAVHMANLTDEYIEEAASAGVHVVHCPHSNMKLASGFCRVLDLIKAGVNVAIGTDSCASNNKLDMLAEMRTTALLAKVVSSDPTAVGATTALRMATLNGARAIGQGDRTGSLLPGKSADFIALDMGEIESLPMYDVQSHLVYVADRSQVTDVWVRGRRLLAERELTSIDYGAAKAAAHAWATKVKPSCEKDGGEDEEAAAADASAKA